MNALTQLPQWRALTDHHHAMAGVDLRQLFARLRELAAAAEGAQEVPQGVPLPTQSQSQADRGGGKLRYVQAGVSTLYGYL